MTEISKRTLVISGIVAVSLMATAAAGAAMYWRQNAAALESGFNRLTLFHQLRKATLEDYMRSKASDVRAMSRSPRVVKALSGLDEAWQDFGDTAAADLRKLYVDNNAFPVGQKRSLLNAGDDSRYSKIHQEFHDWARRFLDHFGYHDMYLINLNGDIIYSVQKATDYATNLDEGAYADSPLGYVYAQGLRQKGSRVAISDFARYAPKNNEPAAFSGSAVLGSDGKPIGVFAVQLPSEPINDILRAREGMGKSGETYIVGNDFKMRSQSRFVRESTVLEQMVDTEAVRQGLNSFSGAKVIDNYRGRPVLSVYSPLDFGGEPWVLLAEIGKAEIIAGIRVWLSIAAALLAGLAMALTAYITAKLVFK